ELGSPMGAATSSFASFAVGALLPLLPFLLLGFGTALMVAVALCGLALFVVGAMAARLSGRAPLYGGGRGVAGWGGGGAARGRGGDNWGAAARAVSRCRPVRAATPRGRCSRRGPRSRLASRGARSPRPRGRARAPRRRPRTPA